jgi:hypothetical protein
LRLAAFLTVLAGLGGCSWVSSKWNDLASGSLFSRAKTSEGLVNVSEGERAYVSGPEPQTAGLTPVDRAAMPGMSEAAAPMQAMGTAQSPGTLPGPANLAMMSDAELRQRVAAIDQQMQSIRTEMNNVRPSIDRLVRMEGDIRQLVQRLTQLSAPAAGSPASTQAVSPGVGAPGPAAKEPVRAKPVEKMPKPVNGPSKPPVVETPVAAGEVDPLFADTMQFGIHLASYRSEGRAAQGWRDYRAHFKPLIDGLQPRVLGIDFNDGRGLFFRLKAGPFDTRADAQKICDAIRERGEFCKVEEFTGSSLAQATAAK